MRPPYFLLVLVVVMATCATVQRSAARREREIRIARMEQMLREEEAQRAAAEAQMRSRPQSRASYTVPAPDGQYERSLRISREECENTRPTEVRTRTGPGGMTVQTYRDADCSRLMPSRR